MDCCSAEEVCMFRLVFLKLKEFFTVQITRGVPLEKLIDFAPDKGIKFEVPGVDFNPDVERKFE